MANNEHYPAVLTGLRIREILKEQTDADHPMPKKDIADKLHCEWRKIGNALLDMDTHNMIHYDEIRGKGVYYVPDGEKDFSLAEIRMLIDSVLASRQFGQEETRRLARKLQAQLNEFDRHHVRYVATNKGAGPNRPTCTYDNIELLDQAIEQGWQIRFDYMTYSIAKTLVREGSYQVSPYQTVFAGGNYLVLAMADEEVRSFRIDRMANLKLLPKVAAIAAHPGKFPEREGNLYVQGHPYMQVGNVEYVEIALKEESIDRAMDAFGEDIRIAPDGDGVAEDEVLAGIRANTEDVYLWALQNGDVATVLKPQRLRDRLRRVSGQLNDCYLRFGNDHFQANLDAITGRVRKGLAKRFNDPRLQMHNARVRRAVQARGEQSLVSLVVMDEYSEEIVRDLRQYTNMVVISIKGPDPDFEESAPMENLSCLAGMQKLEQLELNREDVTDGSALTQCPSLWKLDISFSGIRNLDFVPEMPALRHLEVSGRYIEDFSPLYRTAGLKSLRVDRAAAEKIDFDRLAKVNPELSWHIW